ncbi:MAG: MarR family transcriptional regulator [Frankiaceae bacterium]|nr:MarR family transcriptional regulator [Frankiaceae bacterium]MBV9869233.1 MarR family transcriptional regulator [Frankiaceae bacterium]
MEAWHALIRSANRIVRRLEAELEAEQGLTLPAYEVLAHLSEAPERRLRMSDLAAHAVLTPSGLTRLVDKLAREGLVERQRCGADARVVYACLTDSGMQRLTTAYPTHLRGVREHFIDWLTPQQQAAVSDALTPIIDACREAAEQCAAADGDASCDEALDGAVAVEA